MNRLSVLVASRHSSRARDSVIYVPASELPQMSLNQSRQNSLPSSVKEVRSSLPVPHENEMAWKVPSEKKEKQLILISGLL